VDIEGDGADGVVGVCGGAGGIGLGLAGEGGVGCAGELCLLEAHEAVALAGDDELGVVDEGHAVLAREALGAGADEVDVRGVVEDEACGVDGIAEALDTGDAAGAEVFAVYQESIELDATVAGEEGAAAGVEGVVVFHAGDGGLDGIERAAAFFEEGVTGREGVAYAALVRRDGGVGHGPGAAVYEECGGVAHRILSLREGGGMPSSVIQMMRYDPASRVLVIVYRGGRGIYQYFDVPEEEWEAFRRAGSKGSYLNRAFKAREFRYEPVSGAEAAREMARMRSGGAEGLIWGLREGLHGERTEGEPRVGVEGR